MIMWLRAWLLAACLVALVSPATAQVPLVVRVVTTCGTVPTAYVAGSNSPAVQDVNGQLCTNASSGGGGGTSSSFGAAFPATGTAIGFTDGTNMVAGRTGAVSNVAAATGFLDALGVCQYLASAPTLTDTRYQQCLVDINGNLKMAVASSALPTGAATAANQATEISSLASILAAVQGDVPSVTGPLNAATAAATKMLTTGCQYLSSLPTYTNTQQGACTFDVNGRLLVSGSGGTFPATQSGTWTVQPGNTANTTPWLVKQNDGTNSIILDPCQTVAKTYTPINIGSATTTRIIAPTSAKKTYICSIDLFAFAANNVAIVEGTGGTCGSGTAGVIGGTTTATGISFPAQGGLAKGTGAASVWSTAGTNVDFCLITSTAGPLTGTVAWVQQ